VPESPATRTELENRGHVQIGDNLTGTLLLHAFQVSFLFVTVSMECSTIAFGNTHCVKRRMLKWMLTWGVLGLVIPALLIIRWRLTGASFGEVESILWPSSILTMGLDGPGPRSNLSIVEVYAALIGENVVLYFLVGLLTCPVLFLIPRWRKRAIVD
jgi:hypothetical protein